MADKKSPAREFLEAKKNGFDRISDKDRGEMYKFADAYRIYIDRSKTERETVDTSIELAKAHGFVEYKRGMKLAAGDKVYVNNRGKALMLATIGKRSPAEGVRIAGAHVDCPRLDLKTSPLYEDTEIAYFKTHYYGGIKKFYWLNMPLELHGVVAKKDGTVVKVAFGADPSEPVLVISDILIHLSGEQMKKPLAEAIPGENLNVILGTEPAQDDDGSDRVKLAVMNILHEKYGIVEADLHSAELSLVPAMNSRDVGFDRSLIGAYGHDDRVCGYDALRALLDLSGAPEQTSVVLLCDKEEVGSTGVSGMHSACFDTFMEDICDSFGVPLRVCYENSVCLSNDVAAAYDPTWSGPFERHNSAFLNYGMGITKYTGSRGKSGASDAAAELVARVRAILDDADVVWQMAPLGAVDAGGGGTIAGIMANRNIDTIDSGVPVLGMHSPWEIISKLDLYMTYKGIKAFFESTK